MATTQTLSAMAWEAVIGLAQEPVAGTPVAPTVYIPAITANPSLTNELTPREVVRRQKGLAQSGPGIVKVGGDFDFECNPGTLGTIFGLAFGVDTVSGTAAPYTHTFKLASPLNTFTLSVDYYKGSIHQFVNCKIEQLTLSSKSKEVLTAKATIVGINDIPSSGSLSPTFPSPEMPFVFENITTATINGVTLRATDFNFQLKNNITPAYYTGSGRTAGALNETASIVTGSMTVEYTDETIFDLLNGVTSAPIALKFTHPDGDTLTINLPNVLIESAPISLAKKNVMTHAIKFAAFASADNADDDINVVFDTSASTSFVS